MSAERGVAGLAGAATFAEVQRAAADPSGREHYYQEERQRLREGGMIACVNANPDSPYRQAQTTLSIRRGNANRIGQMLVTARHELAGAVRYEARDRPFPLGRGPVHEATKRVRRLEAELAIAEAAELEAIVALREFEWREAA